MNNKLIKINWPDGINSTSIEGESWLKAAQNAGIKIPTGCLGGSCGACEIEINGKIIRACISTVPNSERIDVEFSSDPYW